MISHNAFADTYAGTIQVGSHPYGVDANSNTDKIYVANYGSGTVSVIDGSTDTVVNTIGGASHAFRLAVNPDTNKIYVTYGSGLAVIDGTSNSIVDTIPLGDSTWGVAVNPNTNKIYVTDNLGSSVAVIDGSTNTVTNTISLGNYIPEYLAVNPSTNKIYVSASLQICGDPPNQGECATHTVFVINGSTNTVASTITVGYFPNGIGVNPNTNKIYIANSYDDSISVINGTTDTVVGSIPVGNQPEDVTANPSTNKIYVASIGDNTVSIINGSSNTVLETIPVGSFPEGIGINANTNKIYVDNGDSGTVSVVNGNSNPNVPYAPQNLQATAVSSSQINLSWTAPSNNGGSAITGYMIERSTDGGSTWSTITPNTGSTGTTYSDTGLVHSTTYTYRVSAINSVGTGMPSNTASATTLNTVPSVPTSLTATAQLLKINLSWNAPSDNGGTPITGYMIERSTNNGNTWSTLVANTGSAGTTYSDTNVLPLTTYTYRVSAINDIGTGNPSNTASASVASTPTLP